MIRFLSLVMTALLLAVVSPAAAMTTQKFEFTSGGHKLSGFLDLPDNGPAKAIIVIVHGYGRTEVAGQTSWYDLRSHFTALGIATVIWDKPGCGQSEGTFDPNQPVSGSAQEVVDAARALRDAQTPGAQTIGLWGISRAGWTAPLAISQDPDIAFWMSASGVDAFESFPYLLESNLRIEGRTEAQIALLLNEWRHGFEISSKGGTYQDYLSATQALRADPFLQWLGFNPDEAAFLKDQAQFRSGAFQVDPDTGLMIYVPGFEAILSRIDIPVLALFGEKDTSVNWRSTKALYERTLSNLTVRTFPDGNHNLQQATTGGLREMIAMTDRKPADGYFETMDDWLRMHVLN